MKNRSWKTIRAKTLLLQPNRLLQRLYPRAIWRSDSREKNIYLTFDDGPVPLTGWVLDQLLLHEAKATFFCVGDNILRHPEIFERIKNEGHFIANHTMHHVKGFRLTTREYLEEVEACEKLTGTGFFRPPYGQLRASQYRALLKRNYRIVMWDVISYDYENITPQRCLANVLRNFREGSIILFHDNSKAENNLKMTLPQVLLHLKQKDFQFKTLNYSKKN